MARQLYLRSLAAALLLAVGIVTIVVVHTLAAAQAEDQSTNAALLHRVSMLLQHGASSFAIPTTLLLDDTEKPVLAIGHFNEDGATDLALAGANSDNLSVVPGDGNAGFHAPISLGSRVRQAMVAHGDFDQDGREDRAVSDPLASYVKLSFNNGSGGSHAYGAAKFSALLLGDFDQDGNPDVAIIDSGSPHITVVLGNEQGEALSIAQVPVGLHPNVVVGEDLNGDGFTDLAVASRRTDELAIVLGDGMGGFVAASHFALDVQPAALAVGDLNGDGIADLAVAVDRSREVRVFLGDGGGDFTPHATVSAVVPTRSDSGSVSDRGRLSTSGEREAATTREYTGIASLTLNPATIAGGSGATSTGTITLNAPAPAGGVEVTLASSNTDLAASVSSVTVPEGATTATFQIGTNAKYRRYSGLAFSANISARHGATSRSATLTVTAQARPGNFLSDSKYRAGLMCGGDFPASAGEYGILFDCSLAPNPGTTGTCRFRQECALGCRTRPASSLTSFKDVCATTGSYPVALNPRYVVGGDTTTGTVFPHSPSQPSPLDAEARVASDSVFANVVPTGFFPIPVGAASASFGVSTTQMTRPSFAAIDGNTVSPENLSGGSIYESHRLGRAWLAVVPPAGAARQLPTLATLAVDPASVVGGNPSQGTVSLSGAAPVDGIKVVVASSNQSVAAAPTTVTVPAGATSASFTIATTAVSNANWINLSASFNGAYREASLQVTPPPPAGPVIAGLSFVPDPVVGGNNSTGTVTLSAAAPAGGATVSLTSEPAVGPHVVTVPASVTVPAISTTASFVATTTAVTQVAASYVRATLGSSVRNTLLDVGPLFSHITLDPMTVVGGNPSTGTIVLNGPAPAAGAVVGLSSNDTAVASVPASVTVPSGATGASFTVTTFPTSAAAFPIITASHGGVSYQRQLRVDPEPGAPPILASLSLSPASVVGGNSSTGTVALSGAAPAGGAAVVLSNSNTIAATVPANVTIAAGTTSANFTVNTSQVMANSSATISGAFGGTTRTAALTVTPPAPAPSNATLTVTATGRGGERITSSPAGINVAVGSTGSASFAVNTSITLSITNGRDAIWSGACSSGSNKTKTCTLTLTGNASATGNVQ